MTSSVNGHYVSMVATLPPYAGPFETPRDPSLLGLKDSPSGVVGLVDVHDYRRTGALQLGHLRTLERLVL